MEEWYKKTKETREQVCLEILESYVEFVETILNHDDNFNKIIAKQRLRDWKPELDKLQKHLQNKK